MRLINVSTLAFQELGDGDIPTPPYASASHRWISGEEVSYKDILKGRKHDTAGYKKVQGFAQCVRKHRPAIEWLWIDTCCINQDSECEKSEAVNTMFEVYRNSEICFTYLHDISNGNGVDFVTSEWFERGWTLQELLAPHNIIFLDTDWVVIGQKTSSQGLASLEANEQAISVTTALDHEPRILAARIAESTGLPEEVLHDYTNSAKFTDFEKLTWNKNRKTNRNEDIWYCMLGIVDITMPIIYGEGTVKAERRLKKELGDKEPKTEGLLPSLLKVILIAVGLLLLSAPWPWAPRDDIGVLLNQILIQELMKELIKLVLIFFKIERAYKSYSV